jgi:hypothetical protein
MTVKEIKQALDLILLKSPQVITPYIHGKPGVGKSAITHQIAETRDIGFIDLRLSQLESSDIRGIPTPDHKNGSSRWLPPETIPFEVFENLPIPSDPKGRKFSNGGILFLDEINRARFDVLQSVFELVYDRRVGLHKILDNWFIVCAGNLGEADKTEVTEFTDAALNNRFIHFYVEDQGLFDCWVEWAEKEGNVHFDVVNFIKTKPSALYTECKDDDVIYCTPRTWDKFSQILKQNTEKDPSDITKIIGKSMLGPTAVGFLDYLRQKSKISPEDVVLRYQNAEIKKKVKNLSRDEKYSLSNEITNYISQHRSMDDKKIGNIHEFISKELEKDHMIAIYKVLVNIPIKYNNKEQEFMAVYLDLYPEFNAKIASILRESHA